MKSVLLFLAGLLVGANIVYFLLVRPGTPTPLAQTPASGVQVPAPAAGIPARSPIPPANAPIPRPMPVPRAPEAAAVVPQAGPTLPVIPPTPYPAPRPPGRLVIPVAGVNAGQLHDTFNDTRGSERRHQALDIMAARGTPVLAARDGKVEKLFKSDRGGLTLYQFDPDGTYAYYYAHLDRYAPGLAQGQQLRRGEVIGYVGSTGNASPDGPHLHFAIFVLGPEKQWWKGTPIDPYPLLTGN